MDESRVYTDEKINKVNINITVKEKIALQGCSNAIRSSGWWHEGHGCSVSLFLGRDAAGAGALPLASYRISKGKAPQSAGAELAGTQHFGLLTQHLIQASSLEGPSRLGHRKVLGVSQLSE